MLVHTLTCDPVTLIWQVADTWPYTEEDKHIWFHINLKKHLRPICAERGSFIIYDDVVWSNRQSLQNCISEEMPSIAVFRNLKKIYKNQMCIVDSLACSSAIEARKVSLRTTMVSQSSPSALQCYHNAKILCLKRSRESIWSLIPTPVQICLISNCGTQRSMVDDKYRAH